METGLTKIEKYTALQRFELCVEMLDSPMARDVEELEIDKVVLPAILKAQKDLGFNPNEEKGSHLMDGIALEIKRAVPNIRLLEIPIAINKGVLGEYGDFLGLSIVTVIKFLKAHYTSAKRAEIAKQVSHKEEEKPIPSIEEQKVLAKLHLIEGFAKYKLTKVIPFSAVYLYRFLNEHFKLVSYSNEVKFGMYHQAVLDTIKDKENESIKDPNTRLSNRKVIDLLRKVLSENPGKVEGAKAVLKEVSENEIRFSLKNQSERIALKTFFDNLIEMEQEITDLLTE
ncbi:MULTISPECIES: hypothetical protein [unclassified Sphingobacterium]|uniref:hypothetical protein n=1 Tax=unclassified Sphingobacterium TaxID=2609468 RepID=UPI0020C40C80|nr:MULTISPECIES: hypothetical protein [unclassified Sphingobacterium]